MTVRHRARHLEDPVRAAAAARPRAPLPARNRSGVRVLAGVPYAAIPGSPAARAGPLAAAGRDAPTSRWWSSCTAAAGGWAAGTSAGPAYAGSRSRTRSNWSRRPGIAVASIDYRLSGEAVWPAQLHDAKAAVRWLRARAGELGIDPDRIAAWGESAGGHLAELLGLTADDAGTGGHGRHHRTIERGRGGGRLVRAERHRRGGHRPRHRPAGPDHPGGAAARRRARRRFRSSPRRPARSATSRPAAPPILLLHGRADRLIPAVQSERLHAALIAAGADAELHLYDGADHMWLGAPEAAADAVPRTIAFLHAFRSAPTTPKHQGDNA